MTSLTLTPSSAPSQTEFSVDEMFFSTTDRKGLIRSWNRVFQRVAGYDDGELLGKNHNLVRHPDMPRAVFQLLWDTIDRGDPIAAYVKNRRKDGSHYWVIASVVPCDDGYLSVRIKPTSPLLATVEPLYAELRAVELAIESGEGRARERAIAASTERLGQRLAELGFARYEDFMRVALPTELAERHAALRQRAETQHLTGDPSLRSVLTSTRTAGAWLDTMFENLSDYRTLNEGLAESSGFVSELADAIVLFSLNALIKALRLGERAAGLGAVADLMGQRSHRIGALLEQLTGDVDKTVKQLEPIAFAISLCKLQIEMASTFACELLEHSESNPVREAQMRSDIAMLVHKVVDEVEQLAAELEALHRSLGDVRRDAKGLAGELAILRALQMNGMVESAHLQDAGDVEALFRQIREQLDSASEDSARFMALTRARDSEGVGIPVSLERDLGALRVLADSIAAQPHAAAA
jgi:aerotaxis receptor